MSQDDRTPIELFDMFCQQLEHHWNTGDAIEYIRPVREALKERDELRAQLAVLHQAIDVTIKRWYDTKDCTLRIDELYWAVDLVSTDRSAQYVRGLEAALQRFIEDPTQPQSYNDMSQHHCAYCGMPAIYEQNRYFVKELRHTEDCSITKARQALAAKEDRG